MNVLLVYLAILLGMLLMMYVAVAVLAAIFIYTYSIFGFRIREADPETCKKDVVLASGYDDALAQLGFRPRGIYENRGLGRVFIAIWEHEEMPRDFMLARCRKFVINEFTTRFTNDVSVTTTNSKDAGLFPYRPGDWTQVFPDRVLLELWKHHQEAETHVTMHGGVSLSEEPTEFPQVIQEENEAAIRHIRTIPFWPFKTPFWGIRRGRNDHLTIAELHQAGKLPLPSAMGTR